MTLGELKEAIAALEFNRHTDEDWEVVFLGAKRVEWIDKIEVIHLNGEYALALVEKEVTGK